MITGRILIVEDERIVARDLERRLTRMGHRVLAIVASGQEAIAKALALHPDVVLMDVRLQGEMDGVEAAQHIQAQVRLPIVFMTAYSDTKSLGGAPDLQPFLYIRKPFEEAALRLTLERALEKSGSENV